MGGLAWWHWVLIIAAFVLLFGAKRLPDAARGVGRSLRILKSEVSAMHDDDAKPASPGETDASAAVATPAAQLAPAPVPTPLPPVAQAAVPVAAPVTMPMATAPMAAAPVAAPAPPVAPAVSTLNGQPVEEQRAG